MKPLHMTHFTAELDDEGVGDDSDDGGNEDDQGRTHFTAVHDDDGGDDDHDQAHLLSSSSLSSCLELSLPSVSSSPL